jgi:hypothetical protein
MRQRSALSRAENKISGADAIVHPAFILPVKCGKIREQEMNIPIVIRIITIYAEQ